MYNFYVMKRDNDFVIACVAGDNNPLYGLGSWDLYSGPWSTIEDAENDIPSQIELGKVYPCE